MQLVYSRYRTSVQLIMGWVVKGRPDEFRSFTSLADSGARSNRRGRGSGEAHSKRRERVADALFLFNRRRLPANRSELTRGGNMFPIYLLQVVNSTGQDVGKLRPTGQEIGKLRPTGQDIGKLRPTGQDIGKLRPTGQDIGKLRPTGQDIGKLRPTGQDIGQLRPTVLRTQQEHMSNALNALKMTWKFNAVYFQKYTMKLLKHLHF
ncbi:hypothetical protein Btru_039016 [Bulinus truncatus]|nr:hypothetical protein Btru_039016 [Bulinus truncatus]